MTIEKIDRILNKIVGACFILMGSFIVLGFVVPKEGWEFFVRLVSIISILFGGYLIFKKGE